MAAATRHSVQRHPRPGTHVYIWAATLIFTAHLPRPLWSQTTWTYGASTITASAGVSVGIGTLSPDTSLTLQTTATGYTFVEDIHRKLRLESGVKA